MTLKQFGLSKSERLCSKRLIEDVYLIGTSGVIYPIRYSFIPVINLEEEESHQLFPVQVLFSASRKKFKSAVKRNLLKRRMREAYRLNKQPIYDHLKAQNQKIAVSLVYIAKEIEPYEKIECAMKKILKRLATEITPQKEP